MAANRPADQPVPNQHVTSVITALDVLSRTECQAVLELAASLHAAQGIVEEPTPGNFNTLRDSKVVWVTPSDASQWLYERVTRVIAKVNQSYKFDVRGFFDDFQVAEYRSGGHYDWHWDIGGDGMSLRKISMSIQLTDGSDYDGGDVEIHGPPLTVAPRGIGSLVVFPSYALHRVTPVTRGVRHSLVVWAAGPPFH